MMPPNYCEACGKPDCINIRREVERPKPKGFRAWLRGDLDRERRRIQDSGTLEGLDTLWTFIRYETGGAAQAICKHATHNIDKAVRERRMRWHDGYISRRIVDLLGAVYTLQRDVKALRQELDALKKDVASSDKDERF